MVRKVDDHAFFAGKGSPTFPEGVHRKTFTSAEGAGHMSRYEDTEDQIKGQQEANIRKIKSQPMKDHYRN